MTYPDFNQPMQQFVVLHNGGRRVLTVVDPTRYDAFYGFHRVIAVLDY